MRKYILLAIVVVTVVILLFGTLCYRNQVNKKCYDLKSLSSIMGIDFEKYKIEEIKARSVGNSTEVIVKVTSQSDMELYQEFEKKDQGPSEIINRLKDLGVDGELISCFCVNYKEFTVPKLLPFLGTEYRPYEVWLFFVESSENNQRYTLFVYTQLPYEICINIADENSGN